MSPRVVVLSLGVAALGLLAGCATPYRNALPSEASRQMQNTAGVVALQQHEIDTSINPSGLTAAAGGGLIWAIIDATANAHSAKKNENFAADLRQALLDYKFDDDALGALSHRFDQGEGVRLTTVVVSPDTTIVDLNKLIAAAQGDAVAVLFVHHLMNPPFTRVVVTANVLVCAKSDTLRALAKDQTIGRAKVRLLYRNGFQSAWNIPDDLRPPDTKRENMVVAWATEEGRPVRDVLHAACEEIAAMLQWDLSLPTATNDVKPGTRRTTVASFRGPAAAPLPGHPVKTEDRRVWIRINDGQLYAEPQ